MMGAARSASLRDVAPLNAGTARLFWRGAPMRHSTLALPGLSGRSHSALALPMFLGVEGALATRDWHCQVFLAGSARAPPRIGIARESRRPVPPPFTPHSANCNAACANCNASLPAPPVKWPHKRYEPNRKEHPMFTELCIAFYTLMTLGIASAFLFTHAQQAK